MYIRFWRWGMLEKVLQINCMRYMWYSGGWDAEENAGCDVQGVLLAFFTFAEQNSEYDVYGILAVGVQVMYMMYMWWSGCKRGRRICWI
jgi:hypothetical protein